MPSGGPPPKKKEEKAFDASSKTEKKEFDDLGTSKQSKKAARSGNRFGGLGAALGGIWGGGLGSDDDDDDEKPGGALGRPLSEVTSALTIGGAAAADEPGIGELSPRRKRGGETFGGVTFGGWGEMATGLTADLRQGELGNCWLISAMMSVAEESPGTIRYATAVRTRYLGNASPGAQPRLRAPV